MSLRDWFRPPRHLVAMFLLVTVVPSLLLLVFGWRLLQQESTLEQARSDARRGEAADLIVTALEQALAGTEETLRDSEAMRLAAVTPDSVTLAITESQLEVLPHGRLLYYPVASAGDAAPDHAFADGEALEHARNDPRAAAEWFERLARHAPAPVRAGALVRAARNWRKFGRPETALALYSAAARLATTAIGDVPTELFARSERCSVLAEVRRVTELRREALELRDLLLEGRWRITRPVFEVYLESASLWSGAGEPPANHLLALSTAVDLVWSSRPTVPSSTEPATRWIGRRSTMSAREMPFVVLSQRIGSRAHVLVAGPTYVREQWKSRIGALEARHGIRSTLQPPGQVSAPDFIHRAASETGLPWTIVVADASGAAAPSAQSRWIWLALTMILVWLLAGSYVVGRALSRELTGAGS